MIAARPKPPDRRSRLIYDRGKLIGVVSPMGERFLALDRDGRRLGLFEHWRQAERAVLALRNTAEAAK